MAKDAGADIIDAVNKCVASTSKERHMEQDIRLVVNNSLSDRAVKVLCILSGKCQGQSRVG